MATLNPHVFTNMATALAERIPEPREIDTGISYAQAVVGQTIAATRKMAEAVDKIEADEDITDIGKAKQRAKTISLYAKPVLEHLLKAQERIKEEGARTVSIINTLPELTADEKAMGVEIRNHCKSLPTSERLGLLAQAQESGDMLTIRSLLDGPNYLTGLPPAVIEDTRSALKESLSPSEAAQRGRLDETRDILNIVTEGMQTMVIENEAAAV